MKKIETRPNGTTRVMTINEEPSMTDQAFKDDVNVNLIMERFMKTGHLPLRQAQPIFADLSMTSIDLPTALRMIRDSEKAFGELPVEVRQKFGYSPEAMILFLQNPENHKEAIELGLLEVREPDKQDIVVDELRKLNNKLEKQQTAKQAKE